jgi:hypothetical protein
MTLFEFLKEIPNFHDYSRKSKLLLLAYYLRQHKGLIEFSSKDIENCCQGIIKPPSQPKQQLVLLLKGKSSPFMKGINRSHYSLTAVGMSEVESYLSAGNKAEAVTDRFLSDVISYLRKFISKITEENQRKFIAEAVACLGVDARRATIVMTWAATIDHLYDHILKHKLDDFNRAIQRRSEKNYSSLTITSKDDFGDIRESVFIEICKSARIISSDVRKILNEKLGIRNTCAHPSGIEVHPSKVVNFVEDLVDNVIGKYEI